jgi:hypothetical protein
MQVLTAALSLLHIAQQLLNTVIYFSLHAQELSRIIMIQPKVSYFDQKPIQREYLVL